MTVLPCGTCGDLAAAPNAVLCGAPLDRALLLLVAAISFAAVGLGALAAGLAHSLEQALPIALALVLPIAAIGGWWWPLHVEPGWMRALADWTPSRWAMGGLVDLVLRDSCAPPKAN